MFLSRYIQSEPASSPLARIEVNPSFGLSFRRVRLVSEDRTDISQVDVDREFSKAEQMLADARKAAEVGISKATIVNRLYYACFHAAQAALYARGFDPRSHGRVKTLIGRELIQNADVSREFGR